MVIIDTTVWVDYFRGIPTAQVNWLDRELTRQRLGLTDLILSEVLQGVRTDRQFRDVQRELSKLEIFTMGGVAFAVAAAQHYRTLRTHGYTIRRTIDCWIATFCLLGGHTLLHNDRDFDPFEHVLGLRVVHP